MSLSSALILSVLTFAFISAFLFIQHELNSAKAPITEVGSPKLKIAIERDRAKKEQKPDSLTDMVNTVIKRREAVKAEEEEPLVNVHDDTEKKGKEEDDYENKKGRTHFRTEPNIFDNPEKESDGDNSTATETDPTTSLSTATNISIINADTTSNAVTLNTTISGQTAIDAATEQNGEKRGILICNGTQTDSEIIYWKIVPGDATYESPITPHHGDHHDKYLSFEYDNGGWNNVRMSLECLIVVAHAMGRTLVIPPQQHLYLLGKTHTDKHDMKEHDEMGFEDFFDIDLLRSHKGFHTISMNEFLEKEAAVGGLNPSRMLLPKNDTDLWGSSLWYYLNKVADVTPAWLGKFMAFPDRPGDFALSEHHHPRTKDRLIEFGGDRYPHNMMYYDEALQKAHHIHIRGDGEHRVLQHHYAEVEQMQNEFSPARPHRPPASHRSLCCWSRRGCAQMYFAAFAFFADPHMQSFYRRFVRDYMRYKDNIQCVGAEMVSYVRADALRNDPSSGGEYYALHVRRGDFQFKDVKISASEIVANLNFTGPDGKPIIPPGSLVYLSTDDPDGICKDCYVQRKRCDDYPKGSKPVGCPEVTSWDAMREYGWKLRFLRDYLRDGYLQDVNPNLHGMVESIVCSRAKVFAGTYFSTFTGYIHRLRGFHGLGEATYYHHKHYVGYLQKQKSVGHGFSREWRAGWTDDGGELI